MSINIHVGESVVSIRNERISLVDFEIGKKKSKKRSQKISIDKIGISAKKSSEKVDEKVRRNSSSKQKTNIAKGKENNRRKLMKFEKSYKYLENVCYEYTSQRDNQNKSLLETNGSKASKRSVSTLLELTQQVLDLEQEVDAVLISVSSRQRNDYNCNSLTDDGCEITDFLLRLDKVKERLISEFNLDVCSQVLDDDSWQLENGSELHNSSKEYGRFLNNVCDTEKTLTSSRLDENQQMIDILTKDILIDLEKYDSSFTSNREINYLDDCKQTNLSYSTPVLSDIPKILPSFSRNSFLRRERPPANLMCKQYKRLDIDFTIHELSAIYETDSDVNNSQRSIASLK